jgi:hypothetical protein
MMKKTVAIQPGEEVQVDLRSASSDFAASRDKNSIPRVLDLEPLFRAVAVDERGKE